MVLEMQAANLRVSSLRTELNVSNNKVQSKVVEAEKAEDDIIEKMQDEKRFTIAKNDIQKKYETKVSTLQVVDEALSKDEEILNNMRDLVDNTDFKNLTREEKVEIQEKLIQYVDDINKISINTEFNDKTLLDGSYADSDSNNNERLTIERIDSQTLGLSVDNISRLKLDSIRVAGESYMPPYSFDVTETSGASTALSVIGSAISKIDSYRRQVAIDISSLTRYPEVLELDRNEYSAEITKIRNAESARRLVEKLQSSIRFQISQAQRSQILSANQDILNIFINS